MQHPMKPLDHLEENLILKMQQQHTHKYQPLAANIAPVIAPLAMEFQGSSLSRTAMRVQSSDEYRPHQTAKLP